MKLRFLAVFFTVFFFVSSCATVSTFDPEELFSPTDNMALLIVEDASYGSSSTHFNAIDIATMTFLAGKIDFTDRVPRLASTSGKGSTNWQVLRVLPGNYALTSRVTQTYSSGRTTITHHCYTKGTQVHQLEAGKAYYIEDPAARSLRKRSTSAPADLVSALSAYKGINQKIAKPKVSARIKFEGDDGFWGISCPKGKKAELISDEEMLKNAIGSDFSGLIKALQQIKTDKESKKKEGVTD